MVAQAKGPRTRKPAQPTIVVIEPGDVTAGKYGALSSAGDRWYVVNVSARTCTCPAGERHFEGCKKGACKHLIAARVIARALASMTPTDRAAALCLQNLRVNVDRVDLAALDAPLARPTAAALMEAYRTAA